ncbi:hypothetical protein Poly24_42580 [Rosistilla carotiformis]|uniref:Uncharacterized protein n=1 Tax=Rosistilla carotiformis TaxID=2528017 RepID=A0A518JYB7_9BACT|nr:hypothetical protein [Rosistilla carotiformis]QDV70534.1 hypothetical protein Poly24_42580 [Rosistilla carotiformis]
MGNNLENFEQTVQCISDRVLTCIRQQQSLQASIADEPDSIFIKSANGHTQIVNSAYHLRFTAGIDPAGKPGDSYLHSSIIDVSQRSDKMVLGGCSTVQFNHVGEDALGRTLQFRTYKRSLQEAGDPRYAILGITRVLGIVASKAPTRSHLSDKWQRFEQLDPTDRQLAIEIAGGRRTIDHGRGEANAIDSRYNAILQTMEVESQVELIKLLVRLQDNGFGDLGI